MLEGLKQHSKHMNHLGVSQRRAAGDRRGGALAAGLGACGPGVGLPDCRRRLRRLPAAGPFTAGHACSITDSA